MQLAKSISAQYKYDDTRIRQCIEGVLAQVVRQTSADLITLTARIRKPRTNTKRHILVVKISDPTAALQKYQADAYFSPRGFFRNKYLSEDSALRLSVYLSRMVARALGGDIALSADPLGLLEFEISIPIRFVSRKGKPVQAKHMYQIGKKRN